MNAIEIRDLKKSFRGMYALNGLNMTVPVGAIAGLPFVVEGISAINIVMSMLSKIFIVAIFVSIYILASIFAKQKLWLSLILSLAFGMLFFTMIHIITPLNSGFINVILCFFGGLIFSVGVGVGSYYVLKKISLI